VGKVLTCIFVCLRLLLPFWELEPSSPSACDFSLLLLLSFSLPHLHLNGAAEAAAVQGATVCAEGVEVAVTATTT